MASEDNFDKCTVAHERMARVETHLEAIDKAFVKNDLGEVDYDGHRRAHADAIEAANTLKGYKNNITTKVGAWSAIGAISAIITLFLDWIKDHIK